MTIVLCAKGYPGKYIKHKKIKMIDQLPPSKKNFIYHAGTKLLNGENKEGCYYLALSHNNYKYKLNLYEIY